MLIKNCLLSVVSLSYIIITISFKYSLKRSNMLRSHKLLRMGSTLLIGSRSDPASINIVESILSHGKWNELNDISSGNINDSYVGNIYTSDSKYGYKVFLWMIEQPLLTLNYADKIFNKIIKSNEESTSTTVSNIIFLSRHQASSGTLSLTVHPIGIPWMTDASQVGGLPGKCSPPSPHISSLLRALIHEAKEMGKYEMFQVTLEATHHGPYVEIPTCFVEIGSTPNEWQCPEAGAVWSNCLLKYFSLPFKSECDSSSIYDTDTTNDNGIAADACSGDLAVVMIGGGHYVPKMNDMARYGEGLYIGHALTSYALQPHLDRHNETSKNGDSVDPSSSNESADSSLTDVIGGWKGVIREAITSTLIALPNIDVICLVDKKAFNAFNRDLITGFIENELALNWTFKTADVKKLWQTKQANKNN